MFDTERNNPQLCPTMFSPPLIARSWIAGVKKCFRTISLLSKEECMNHYLMLVVAAVVFVGGCGKKEEKVPSAPQPSLMKPGDPLPPSAPTPPIPAPDVPKGADTDFPKPGQANDHSSPAFKDGGKTSKTK